MKKTKKMVLSAMFLSIGLVLPFVTGQIQHIGSMLLPMHIPVMLCGLICGWQWGLIVGFILPLMRSFLFHMPVMYPNAVAMAFELATYGFMMGYLYSRAKWQCTKMLYKCMVISMLAGRLVWGVVQVVLLGVGGFTLQAFMAGAFLNAIPGIIVQLIVIPQIMVVLNRAKLVPFKKKCDKRERYGIKCDSK